MIHPLNKLLRKQQKWVWDKGCEKAFSWPKQALASSPVLVHYDPSLPIHLAADVSAYGIGAVISHVARDGSEHPIAFASCSLSVSERNYSQIEKEALALVFGVRKFHQFIYGRHFTLVTDHKPLLAILGPKKEIPPLAAARMQRWAFQLSGHDYDTLFKPTTAHCNADGLSRLPLPQTEPALVNTAEIAQISLFNIAQIQALPISSHQLGKITLIDPILSKVYRYTMLGWPPGTPEESLTPYWNRRNDLTVEGECVMLGIRVVVPKKLQESVLKELHSTHPGIQHMRSLERSHVWWPGLEKDIDQVVKSCRACHVVKQPPAVAPLHPWVWPSRPWTRIHVDFEGPFLGKSFLIVVDAYSKWPEVWQMSSTTATKTIEVLRHMFVTYGLPKQLVSDNAGA